GPSPERRSVAVPEPDEAAERTRVGEAGEVPAGAPPPGWALHRTEGWLVGATPPGPPSRPARCAAGPPGDAAAHPRSGARRAPPDQRLGPAPTVPLPPRRPSWSRAPSPTGCRRW